MSVRVTVEGGGSFELDDLAVRFLRHLLMGIEHNPTITGDELLASLAAALPPEPYQPKEGDRVRFCYDQAGSQVWSIICDYLGTWHGWHVLRAAGLDDDSIPFLERPATEFRRADA